MIKDEVKRAAIMKSLMAAELKKLKTAALFREYNGFEQCYNMFTEYYADIIKKHKTDSNEADIIT